MDDVFYLDMARNALRNPLPERPPLRLRSRLSEDLDPIRIPPLQTYFLAVVLPAVGEGAGKEWIFHSAAMRVSASGSHFFLRPVRPVLNRPFRAAALFACAPVLMVMEHTLMTTCPPFLLGGLNLPLSSCAGETATRA